MDPYKLTMTNLQNHLKKMDFTKNESGVTHLSDEDDNDSIPCSDSSGSFHSFTEDPLDIDCKNNDFAKPEFSELQSEDFIEPNVSKSEDIPNDEDFQDEPCTEDSSTDQCANVKFFINEELLDKLDDLSEDIKKEHHLKALEYKAEGNELFKMELYEVAAIQYTEALRECPRCFKKDRSVFYGNRAAARAKIDKEEIKEAIKDCGKAIELDSSYFKVILRRARLHQEADNLDDSLKDFQKVLELDPANSEARQAITVLPQRIEERNEKMKEEMFGKLKELGNMVLKPFGLSTNNFELKKNDDSGGYNIDFKQNPT